MLESAPAPSTRLSSPDLSLGAHMDFDPEVDAKRLAINARRKLALGISLLEQLLAFRKDISQMDEQAGKELQDHLFEANCAVIDQTQELVSIKGQIEFHVLLLKAWVGGPETRYAAIKTLESVASNLDRHLV